MSGQRRIDNQVLDAILSRRSERRFSSREVPRSLIIELLEAANTAPSSYNLQPWHFIIVDDDAVRRQLYNVCMKQQQVLEAPVSIAVAADPYCWHRPYQKILQLSVREQVMDAAHARKMKKAVETMLDVGPFNVLGFLKRLALPITRLRAPMPNVFGDIREVGLYVGQQAMLAASTFMIAARSAGLHTCPIEYFDEYRLRRLLKLPRYMRLPLVICTGYAADEDGPVKSIRLPIEEKLSLNTFRNKLRPRQS